MKWASVISTEGNLGAAVRAAHSDLLDNLSDTPSLVFVFVSPFYKFHFDILPDLFTSLFPETVVIGCAASGIFAGGVELEHSLGVGMIGAVLPDVKVLPFYLNDSHSNPLELLPEAAEDPQLVLFSDPLTFNHDEFVMKLNQLPGSSKIIGGLASGASESDYNVLFLNGSLYKGGAVGLLMTGNITLEQFVSQGSKAIGAAYFATRVRGNIVYELDGLPADGVVTEMLSSVSETESLLFEAEGLLGIYEGAAYQESTTNMCDIRQIIGIDSSTAAIILDEPIAENSIVRFHIGDPFVSHDRLLENCKKYQKEFSEDQLSGALVFSCARRGEEFYQEQGHETNVFKECFDSVPLGGFFSNGELVQENGKARVCGLTSAFGFFRPRR